MLDLNAVLAPFPTLETERLRLRALEPGDAPAMFAMLSDPQVLRYISMRPMEAPEQATKRITEIQATIERQSGIDWAITRRDTGEYLGKCGFWRLLKEHHRAEIGYELARHAWGQGIVVEAAAAILAFGFTRMGLHSVEAQIHPANQGSRRVLEKLGFVQEGYFRENFYDLVEVGFTDTAVFSLLKADWERRQG